VRFGSALRSATRELSAPPGARLRILEEVGADLEDLYAALRASGLGETEARRRAEMILLPGEAAAVALSNVHRPLWMRLRDRYGSDRHGAERTLLSVSALIAVFASVAALVATGLLANPSPFVIVLVVIAVLSLLHAGSKAVRVWVAGESSADRIREGTGALLVAAIASIVAAGFGMIYELYGVAVAVEAVPEREGEIVLAWLRTNVVLGVLGLVISMTCGLLWMLFVRRAAIVEMRERALLGPTLHVGSRPKARSDGVKASLV
jgi:hypothetical protein